MNGRNATQNQKTKKVQTPSAKETIQSHSSDEDGAVIPEATASPGICTIVDCTEKRTMNKKGSALIRVCVKHAEEHRLRCQASYRRKLSRNQAIGQQKSTIGDLKSTLTDERITIRRLRKRLENIQREHDTFVATVTSTSTAGTPQGDHMILSVLQKLHSSVNELTIKTENEESFKQKLKDMENNYDKLLNEKEALQEKVANIKGQLLSQKQIMDICMPRKPRV